MPSMDSTCRRSNRAALPGLMMSPLLFLWASIGMLKRIEPFFSWYYVFSWWSYIVFVESCLHWKGFDSSLFRNPRRFLLQLPLSVTIWLVFELFNFRLQNWHYVHLPPSWALRWPGYAMAFATVLPGLDATAALLRSLLPLDRLRCRPISSGSFTGKRLMATGLLFLLLPLLWPKFFFPCVWLGFIFILVPSVHRPEPDDLVEGLRSGKPGKLVELLLAGMICGWFWEFWNYWAGAKWVYTVPFVGWPKIFEMPLLGFLGFPPFAVECYLMSRFAFQSWHSLEAQRSRGERWSMRCLLGVAVLLFWVLVFWGIDRKTVLSYGV